jgi:DNA-binding Xre family transcriptional regulator
VNISFVIPAGSGTAIIRTVRQNGTIERREHITSAKRQTKNKSLHIKQKYIDIAILLLYNIVSFGGVIMAFSYKPLWKLLIDKEMTKKQLMESTGISKSTMDKMGRGESVSMEIIDRICSYFNCDLSEILEHIQEK